jgi:sigma-B regulation protein RsbU (phosphoserine phosphatase)
MTPDQYDPRFLLQNLMDNMTDNIYFKDLQSRFILVNKAAATWHGYDNPDDALGKSDFDNYKEAAARRMFDAEQRIIATGEPLEGIVEKDIWKDGQEAWVSTTKMPLRDAAGKIVGTFGVSRDITKQKEAELKAAYYAKQIKRIKEEMEEEVRMAAELQKTFFPRSYPVFPRGVDPAESAVLFHHHYRASGMVSGDFCSVRRLSETESGILLCDVMGHGVRAALGTALIYAMVEELTHQERDPGQFLGRLNALLLPILQQEDMFLYATACYAVFNAATGQLRIANAGHPVPLHFQAFEKKAEWLMENASLRGPALAIAEDAVYSTVEVQLQPEDTVVMYTDGLYEIEGPDSEEFGEERLLAAAQRHVGQSLSQLFPALIDESSRFSSDGVFDDDVCLVGFSYQKSMELKDA